jgi:hypothetical protein
MRRLIWVAGALLLSACAPPGYVFDGADFLHPHPSAALCASKNLQLDPVTKECVVPVSALPSASSPRRAPSPPHGAAPAARAESKDAPIEPGAEIKDDIKKNVTLLRELVRFVRENGHQCDAISAVQANTVSRRFKLVCDRSHNTYEIEAQEGHWVVTPK